LEVFEIQCLSLEVPLSGKRPLTRRLSRELPQN
jgi:hypothetical protein